MWPRAFLAARVKVCVEEGVPVRPEALCFLKFFWGQQSNSEVPLRRSLKVRCSEIKVSGWTGKLSRNESGLLFCSAGVWQPTASRRKRSRSVSSSIITSSRHQWLMREWMSWKLLPAHLSVPMNEDTCFFLSSTFFSCWWMKAKLLSPLYRRC